MREKLHDVIRLKAMGYTSTQSTYAVAPTTKQIVVGRVLWI